mmetsp:Transcript_34163/g.52431  ORF Transcript_34163/g.52431 Transcript_34163/m.52431 type:complete len:118 (-) Transcript_34163:1122-1475(-)
MFESEDKKSLSLKYNKMQGMAASKVRKFKFAGGGEASKSVYGELKLSEKLAEELESVRDHVNSMNEFLEEARYERDTFKRELDQVTLKLQIKVKEVETQKREIMQMRLLNQQTQIQC